MTTPTRGTTLMHADTAGRERYQEWLARLRVPPRSPMAEKIAAWVIHAAADGAEESFYAR